MNRAEKRKLITDMYLGGHPLKEIAAATGYTIGGLCNVVRRQGAACRARGAPPQKEPSAFAARVLSLYNEGHSVAEVAGVAGISRQRVHQILNRWQPSLSRRAIRRSESERVRRINYRAELLRVALVMMEKNQWPAEAAAEAGVRSEALARVGAAELGEKYRAYIKGKRRERLAHIHGSLRQRWADPAWRAWAIAQRHAPGGLYDKLRQRWQDPGGREKLLADIKKARAAKCQPAPGKEGSDTPTP